VQFSDNLIGVLVMIVNVRVAIPSGHLNPSHSPANAIG
jgi:hypothetical protein